MRIGLGVFLFILFAAMLRYEIIFSAPIIKRGWCFQYKRLVYIIWIHNLKIPFLVEIFIDFVFLMLRFFT